MRCMLHTLEITFTSSNHPNSSFNYVMSSSCTDSSCGTETTVPSYYTIIGAILALIAASLNAVSFVYNRKAFNHIQAKQKAEGREKVKGTGYEYLKNGTWWIGMTAMGLAEVINTIAFAFAPVIIVAPLGAWSVALTAVLASFILKERLSFSGKIGAALCMIGSIAICVTAPAAAVPTHTIEEFTAYLKGIAFIVYAAVCFVGVLVLNFWAVPRWGTKNIMVHITIASIVGSFLVQIASGVGSAVVYSIGHFDTYNVFVDWQFWLLFVILVILILFQIAFINKAIACFHATIVMPIYFVSFTIWTFVTFLFLYGFGSGTIGALAAVSLVLNFLVIVCGVALLVAWNRKVLKSLLPETLHQTMIDSALADRALVDEQWEERASSSTEPARLNSSEDGLTVPQASEASVQSVEMVQLASPV
jgi:hypothetical protein